VRDGSTLTRRQIGARGCLDGPATFALISIPPFFLALFAAARVCADLLMPELRFRLWPIHVDSRLAWVQIAADHVGLVVAQVGAPLPAMDRKNSAGPGLRRVDPTRRSWKGETFRSARPANDGRPRHPPR
jgi:hypothetical protein